MENVKKQEVDQQEIDWRISARLYGGLMLQQQETTTRSSKVVDFLHARTEQVCIGTKSHRKEACNIKVIRLYLLLSINMIQRHVLFP